MCNDIRWLLQLPRIDWQALARLASKSAINNKTWRFGAVQCVCIRWWFGAVQCVFNKFDVTTMIDNLWPSGVMHTKVIVTWGIEASGISLKQFVILPVCLRGWSLSYDICHICLCLCSRLSYGCVTDTFRILGVENCFFFSLMSVCICMCVLTY